MTITRDERRTALHRIPKFKLILMCRTGVQTPTGVSYIEGGMYPLEQWSKDDLVSSILSAEYPSEVTR